MTPEELAAIFAANVRALLVSQGASQSDLARRLEVSRAAVTILLKSPTPPSLTTVAKVAEALGVEPHVLITPAPVEAKPVPAKKSRKKSG